MHHPHPNRFLAFAAAAVAAVLLSANAAFAANDKVALLIGNNKYGTGELRNAVNDAKDLGEALKELGFKVIVRENATRKDMIEAIVEFGKAIDGANVALFFYAGHGMQFKDNNYLIPIDVTMGSEEDVTFFAINLQQVFDRMDRARTRQNFIILDACRDNPFASSFKVSSAGLAQMNAPTGTMIAYATAPGSVAQDGFQRNGVYTKHILRNIKVPDVPVEAMFKRVREGVEHETRKQQTPWDSSSLKGEFAFNASGAAAATTAQRSAAPSTDVALSMEREFWQSVRESKRPEDYQAYLEKYPTGTFSTLARNSLEALKRAAAAEPTRIAAATPAEQSLPRAVELRPAAPQQTAPQAASPPPVADARPAADQRPPTQPPSQASTARPADPPPPKPAPEKPVVVAAAPASAPPPAAAPSTAAMPATAPAIAPSTAAPAAPPVKDEAPGREVAPGVREVTFADGAIYRGGLRGTLLHGKGQYVAKAFKYEGEFKDGLKDGQGTYVWDNGNRYEGPFSSDSPNGIGKYFFANGDTYTGEVKAGSLTGRGIYVTKAGDTLEGTFVDGSLHGPGTHRFASGDRYEGENVKGKPHGKGRYYGTDGHRVEGEFVDGHPHGKGIYHFANGDRYEGDITHSELTGNGAYFYKSGLKYEGQMVKGQPQGEGTFWFADGSRFEGRFENGLARAVGRLIKPDGASSPAEIVNGQARTTP